MRGHGERIFVGGVGDMRSSGYMHFLGCSYSVTDFTNQALLDRNNAMCDYQVFHFLQNIVIQYFHIFSTLNVSALASCALSCHPEIISEVSSGITRIHSFWARGIVNEIRSTNLHVAARFRIAVSPLSITDVRVLK